MNSIAVGIAIDEGKLHLDDLVIDYFKEYLPEEYDKRIDQLTVRNLLTMAANSCRLSTCFRGVTDSWITHYFTYKLPHDPELSFSMIQEQAICCLHWLQKPCIKMCLH